MAGYLFDFVPEIDFCVWVLQRAGLTAGAFSRQETSEPPTVTGLDAEEWQEWLRRIVTDVVEGRLMAERTAAVAGSVARDAEQHYRTDWHGRTMNRAERAVLVVRIFGWMFREMNRRIGAQERYVRPPPAALWPGLEEMRERLEELWTQYQEIAKARRRGRHGASMLRFYESPEFDVLVTEWKERLNEGVLGQRLFQVNYPGPMTYVLPALGVVVGVRGWKVEPAAMLEILQAALDRSR